MSQDIHTGERASGEQIKKRPKTILWAAIAGLLLVALLGWVVAQQMGPALTERPVDMPVGPSVVESPVEPPPLAPPITERPVVDPGPGEPRPEKQVPLEVLRYLEHLKRVEAYRQSMRDDVGPALDMLQMAYASQFGFGDVDDLEAQRELQRGYSNYAQQWQNLINYFNALQPPPECATLGRTYGEALTSYVYVMNQIQVAMSRADIQALLGLRGKAQTQVDRQLRNADRELTNVTREYGLKKEFDILPDSQVGSLLQGLF